MEQPLVSIVTITRNRAKLLGRCIDSVLGQTYSNIEHIIVDGASDDGTDELVSSYDDPRIRFIRLPESWPIAKAYNYGAKLAEGRYLTFLDSDDEYLPAKIEKEVSKIETLPEDYGMVYCWMTYFDSSRNDKLLYVHGYKIRGDASIPAVIRPSVSGTPTLMFRKETYLEAGGWDEEADMPTDWELCARYCQKWKVDYVPESLVNVYINHMYDRVSYQMRHNRAFYGKRVAMHESYLTEFRETFDKRPGSRWYNYMSLCFFTLVDHQFLKTLRYSFLFAGNLIATAYVKLFGSKE